MPPPKKRAQQRPSPPRAGRPQSQQQRRPQKAASGRTTSQHQQARPFYTPDSTPFRREVERRSAPLLVLLTRAPRLVTTLLPLALLLLGLFLPLAAGLIALAIFLAFTGWLAYLSWPKADTGAKAIRAVMFVLVIGLIVLRVVRA